MLTRIEIDGFKSFENFTIDLRPFLAILGPNASGKSNLFDAIRLLSRLAEHDLRTAFTGLRGEAQDLFRHQPGDKPVSLMRIAAEVLLDSHVADPWGSSVDLIHTRFRYELTIQRRPDPEGNERLFVLEESATPISASSDRDSGSLRAWVTPEFRERYFKYSRRSPLLSRSKDEAGRPIFRIHNDGVQGRPRPASAAEATVLSSITSAEYKHLFALREEMRSWRFLQLDPVAMRKPSPKLGLGELEADGSNLAYVLHRIERETADPKAGGSALADINADLAHLIPGLRHFEVVENRQSQQWEIWLTSANESPFPAAVASDGTLRVLALLAALYDPNHRGVICFEEPENGVHPSRLRDLVEHLRNIIMAQVNEVGPDEPLAQLLLASHSPVVLRALNARNVVFADMVTGIDPVTREATRRTRIRPVKEDAVEQLRLKELDATGVVQEFEVGQYAATAALEG